MEDSEIQFVGTPLEQMVLMLNDKMDALHARVDEVYGHVDSLYRHIDSPKHVIPWAGIGTMRTDHSPPADIDEWTRRGWDVWRVTMPSEPDEPPSYEITNRRVRGTLPTTGHNTAKYDRMLRSGEMLNYMACDTPIERELLTGDDGLT